LNRSSQPPVANIAKQIQRAAENESQSRNLGGLYDRLVSVVSVILGLFHIYTAGFGALMTVQQRAVHLGLSVIVIYMLTAAGRRASQQTVPWYDWLAILLGLAALTLAFFSHERIAESPLSWPIYYLVMGAIAVLVILEGTRRSLGLVFPTLVIIFFVYALVGPWIPGLLHHKGVSLTRILEMSYLNATGLWGTVVGLSSTLIATFIVFGSLLLNTGAGESFFNVAVWISGRSPGGPAKVAVVASMLFGMISGSAAANVATTGTFTIPMMKRTGYRPEFAAATEAVASTGGQLMPPIMGAGAFIMAQFLGLSYTYIALVAILPSAVYYFGTYLSVHLEAVHRQLGSIDFTLPPTSEILSVRKLVPLVGPLAVLFTLFITGYSPGFAGFWAIITTLVLSFAMQVVVEKQQLSVFAGQLVKGFRSAAAAIAGVAVLVAASEIVIGLVALTGISVKIGHFISALAGTSSLLALILAALVVMLFGMGLPTTAAYMLGAAILAPALIGLGYDPLPVHFFVFYYAVLAVLTPPVCAAVFIGAGIAGTGWVKTAWVAMTLAVPAYLLPFVWMFDPSLLLQGSLPQIAASVVNVVAATTAFAVAARGYFFAPVRHWQRWILPIASILLFVPESISSTLGWVVFLSIMIHSYRLSRLMASQTRRRKEQVT
jgi:TRAP transporter 4TM/12TM fusion protein